MEIPFSRWYPVIATRRSRRQFDAQKPISADTILSLKNICSGFRPFPGARVELVPEAPDKLFKFIAGSYGIIKNAGSALIFIGDTNNRHSQEELGYMGEGIILEANALGLSTCWMAGFFRAGAIDEYVKIKANERTFAVSPLGYSSQNLSLMDNIMANFGRHSLRQKLDVLVSGLPEKEWPEWIKPSLEAARQAPSAVNRQPWKFKVESGSIRVSTATGKPDYTVSKRLDCGIAMLHLEVAALFHGIKGRWELLESPDVARFIF